MYYIFKDKTEKLAFTKVIRTRCVKACFNFKCFHAHIKINPVLEH